MTKDLTYDQQPQHQPQTQPQDPFERGRAVGHLNQGSVAIEQERAIAEAQGQLVLAKRFPRKLSDAYAELMDSCKLESLASVAFYSVPRGGKSVTGPSIRLAEEIARCYGNFQYGHRELSRDNGSNGNPGKSEVEVYAWDMEKNNRSIRQITVVHTIDTRQGPRTLRDQKDIDDKIANVASKQVRGRILALLPKWMVESASQACRKTLAGGNDEPLANRVRRMVDAFAKYDVTTHHLSTYLGHDIDDITPDELVDLLAVYNSLREGSPASAFFQAPNDDSAVVDQADAINKAIAGTDAAEEKPAKAKAETKTETKAPPKKAEKPAPAKAKETASKKVEPEPEESPDQTQDGANAAPADDDKELF